MSKLYMKAKSDTCKTGKTMTGNHDLTVELYTGSRENSQKAIELEIISQSTVKFLIRVDGNDYKPVELARADLRTNKPSRSAINDYTRKENNDLRKRLQKIIKVCSPFRYISLEDTDKLDLIQDIADDTEQKLDYYING